MGSGASFGAQPDSYDNLTALAVDGVRPITGSSPKDEKQQQQATGPKLGQILEEPRLQQHFKNYIATTYREGGRQQLVNARQAVTDKAADMLVAIAQTFLQFYLEAADFEKFGDATLRLMRSETITSKYFSNQGEVKLPWGRVLLETTLWKLDEDKVPSADVFRAAKSDAYDYLDTEVFPLFLAEEGPTGYKAGAFALNAARLRKGISSSRKASKEESTLLEQTLMEPTRTAIFKEYLSAEEGSAGPDLLFLLLELLDLKQMMTAIISTSKALDEAKLDENSMRAAGARFIVGRMYKLYDKFLAVGSGLRELFSEQELNSLTALISASSVDLTPARLDEIVQTAFTALCDYYVAYKQDPRSIKALKDLEDAREERKHEIRAYAAQYENALLAAEAQSGGGPSVAATSNTTASTTTGLSTAPSGALSARRGSGVKAAAAVATAPPPRTLEKETTELLAVLNNTELERSFKSHLRKVRRENFLYFWREVEDFKNIPIAQSNYIQGRAEKIFEKYVKRGAASEIPVNVQTRVEILGRLFRADIHIYDQASKDAIRCLLPEYVTWQVVRSQPTFATELRDIDFFDELQVKRSTEANKTLPIPFKELLTVPAYNVCFKRFAEAEFCVSAVLFWNEVQDWKQLPPSSLKDSKFRKIFNKFLKSTANMPIKVSDQAMAEAEREDSSKGKFDTAESEVYMFLKTVLLPKFLESEQFSKLQAAITLEKVSDTLGDDALGGESGLTLTAPLPSSTAPGPAQGVKRSLSSTSKTSDSRGVSPSAGKAGGTSSSSSASRSHRSSEIRRSSSSSAPAPSSSSSSSRRPSSSGSNSSDKEKSGGAPAVRKGSTSGGSSSSSSGGGSSSSSDKRRDSSSGGSSGGGGGSSSGSSKSKRKHSSSHHSLVTPDLTARFRTNTAGAASTAEAANATLRKRKGTKTTAAGEDKGDDDNRGVGNKEGSIEDLRELEAATTGGEREGGDIGAAPAEPKDELLTRSMNSSSNSSEKRGGSDQSSCRSSSSEKHGASGDRWEELNDSSNKDLLDSSLTATGGEAHGEEEEQQSGDEDSNGRSGDSSPSDKDGLHGSPTRRRSSASSSGSASTGASTSSQLMSLFPMSKILGGGNSSSNSKGSLKTLLKDRTALKFFFYFCTATHCEENVLFYLEAEDFKTAPGGIGLLTKQARRVYTSYLGPKAKFPVSISSVVLDEVVANLANPTRALFNDAQEEVYAILERTAFPSFLESPQHEAYKQVRKEVRVFMEELKRAV